MGQRAVTQQDIEPSNFHDVVARVGIGLAGAGGERKRRFGGMPRQGVPRQFAAETLVQCSRWVAPRWGRA